MQSLPSLTVIDSASNQSQNIEEPGQGKLSARHVRVSKEKKSKNFFSSTQDRGSVSDGEESHKKLNVSNEKKLRQFSVSHSPRSSSSSKEEEDEDPISSKFFSSTQDRGSVCDGEKGHKKLNASNEKKLRQFSVSHSPRSSSSSKEEEDEDPISSKFFSSTQDRGSVSDGEKGHKKLDVSNEKKLKPFSVSHSPRSRSSDKEEGKEKISKKFFSSTQDKGSVSDEDESHKKLNRSKKKIRRFSISHSPRSHSPGKEEGEEKISKTVGNKKRFSLPQPSHQFGSRPPLEHQDSTMLTKRKHYATSASHSVTPSLIVPTLYETSSLSYIPLISSLTEQKLGILKAQFEQELGKQIKTKKRRTSSASSSSDSSEQKVKKSKKKAERAAIKLLDTALAKSKEEGAQEAAKALCQHFQFYSCNRLIFAELVKRLDADSANKMRQELTQFIFALLAEMESHALYNSHKILKKIALKGWDLYVPITLHLEDHCAKEMVRLILSQPELHNTLLFSLPLASHLSLDDVIDILCQTYKIVEDSKQKENAITYLASLVQASFLSLSRESCFKIIKLVQDEHSKQLSSPLLKEVIQKTASLITTNKQECSSQEKELELNEKKDVPLKSIQMIMDKKDFSSPSLREIALDLKSFIALSFCQISSLDLVDQNWNKNPLIASHITDFTQKINAITQWAAHCIVKPNTPEQRANRCMFFIELAWQSALVGDFNTSMALYISLICSSIIRLEKTWNCVSPQVMQTHKKLTELFNFSRNFENYREAFRNWWKEPEHQDKTPETCPLPLLVNSLKDLTFIYDGNLDIKEGKLNDEKLKLLANFYESLLACQADLHCADDALLTRQWNTDMMERIGTIKSLMTSQAEIEQLENELFDRSKRRENSSEV